MLDAIKSLTEDPAELLAVSKLLMAEKQLRFVTSKSTFSYFEALDLYFAEHGRPIAFNVIW